MIEAEIKKIIFDNEDKARTLFKTQKHIKKYYRRITLNPFLLTQLQYQTIKRAAENIAEILEKTVRLYFQEKKIQDFFNLKSIQKKIIKNYNPPQRSLYLGRFDGLIDNKNNFKFLEFNINFPGGIDRLDSISGQLNQFYKNVNLSGLKNFNTIQKSFLQMVKKLYKKYANNHLQIFAYGTTAEPQNIVSMQSIAKLIEKNSNIKTKVSHWKDLKYNNKDIYYKNKKVGLIFKTTLIQRLWQYDYSYFRNIQKALERHQVYMFNLPQSYLCGAKNLFALWYEKWFWKYLDPEEVKTIKKVIPLTYSLTSMSINKAKLINNKNNWVIKPIEGIGGRAVHIGKSISSENWEKIVNSHLGNKKWIAQEFIETNKYQILNLDTKNEQISKTDAYLNISPWVIEGKLAGISARYSKDLVINVAKGGGIIPVFLKK